MKKVLSLAVALMLMLGCLAGFSVSAEEVTVLAYHPNADGADRGQTGGIIDYWRISLETPIVINAGYSLEYDVYLEDNVKGLGAINVVVDGFPHMRDTGDGGQGIGVLDQDLNGSHPQCDISAFAYEQWYHRSFPLSIYDGGNMTAFMIASEVQEGETGTALFQNVQILDSTGVVVAELDTTKVPTNPTQEHGNGTCEFSITTSDTDDLPLRFSVGMPTFESEGVWSTSVVVSGNTSELTKDAWIGLYEADLEEITADTKYAVRFDLLEDKTADMPDSLNFVINAESVVEDGLPILTDGTYYDVILFADSGYTVVEKVSISMDDPYVFDEEFTLPSDDDDEPEETDDKDSDSKETGAKDTTPSGGDDKKEEGGCGSVIGAGALILAAVLVAPVAFKKKD